MVKARKICKEKLTVSMIAYIFSLSAVSSCNRLASRLHLIIFIAYHNMTDRLMIIAIGVHSCDLVSKTILGYFNTCDEKFIEYETWRKKCKQLCLLLAIIQ